jgi:acyl carrier protein
MFEQNAELTETRVARVVQRLLAEQSIERSVRPSDDLREAGLNSLNLVNLVLSVEAEFELVVPERSITPANFRTVSSISGLVSSLLSSA